MSSGPVQPQWVRGTAARQAHVGLPPGTVEEEQGHGGFSGPASQLFRLQAPTGWTRIDGPLRPRAFDLTTLDADEQGLPHVVAGNGDVRVGTWALPVGDPGWFFVVADGDMCYLVHDGTGTLETEYGPLAYEASEYLVVPRSAVHRFVPTTPTRLLTVEAVGGAMSLPDRGMLGRFAIFDPAVLEVPTPEPVIETGEFEVRVLRQGELTTVVYPHHPFNVVGWKGDLAPMKLRLSDIRPVMSAGYHLPPSAHTTFVGRDFVLATFCPRPVEEDPEALRLPYYHRNVDFDELVFYHRGRFFSRGGMAEGCLTYHPHGLFHGPHPGAAERDAARGPGGWHHEIAVNVDARNPLELTPAASTAEMVDYHRSWLLTDADPVAAP